jgi:hypothetical protein
MLRRIREIIIEMLYINEEMVDRFGGEAIHWSMWLNVRISHCPESEVCRQQDNIEFKWKCPEPVVKLAKDGDLMEHGSNKHW